MILLKADVARDGGSLGAFFRRDDGNLLSLWLQVGARNDWPARPDYRGLYLSADVRPEEGRLLALGSVEESQLFADLDRWLATPIYSSEWKPDTGWEARAFQRVQDLRTHAAKRLPDA